MPMEAGVPPGAAKMILTVRESNASAFQARNLAEVIKRALILPPRRSAATAAVFDGANVKRLVLRHSDASHRFTARMEFAVSLLNPRTLAW
jgi:hypothetical protein